MSSTLSLAWVREVALLGLSAFLALPSLVAESSVELGGEPLGAADDIDYLRWKWFHDPRFSANAPANPRLTALEKIQQSAQATIDTEPGATNLLWVPIGPSPINGGQFVNASDPSSLHVSGRIVGISIHPTEPDHWLLASAGGGVWETKDAGRTCLPLTDNMVTMGMGSVSFAPGNPSILYAGTSATDGRDKGFLRSTDGGRSWQYLVSPVFSTGDYFTFNAISVDPGESSNVIVATSDFFGPYSATGIFKSPNAGSTWRKRLSGDASSLAVHPLDFAKQYAGIRSVHAGSGSAQNGLWCSLDAAETWVKMEGPWGKIASGDKGILIAIASSQSDTLYIAISGNSLWRTDNAWDDSPSWTSIALPAGKPGFDVLSVDPADPNRVLAGEVNLHAWNGTKWSDLTSGTHVDQHAIAWSQGRFVLGNDGGLWTSTNSGRGWADHNASLATIQFYAGAAHPVRPARALAGSQDNGCELWTGSPAWRFLSSGDGMECAFAYKRPDQRFIVSAQGLYLLRTTDNGASFTEIDAGIESTNRPFYTKVALSPANDDIVLAGTRRLWRTTNAFTGSTVRWRTNSPTMSGSVTAIAFAPAADGSVYAFGTEAGELRITTNNGATWANPDRGNRLPKRNVTGIAFDPVRSSRAYITYSGFNDSVSGHLFLSTNILANSPAWRSIGPSVNLPHNAVLLDPSNPDTLVVATDIGVWRTFNAASSWVQMGPAVGMPNVVVNDLKLAANGDVLAFTYGRGAFALRQVAVPSIAFGGIAGSAAIRTLDHGDIELKGTASNAVSLLLEWSADLQEWSTFQTITPVNGVFDAIVHPTSSSPAFFRAKTAR